MDERKALYPSRRVEREGIWSGAGHVSRGCIHAHAQEKPCIGEEGKESLTAAAQFDALASPLSPDEID